MGKSMIIREKIKAVMKDKEDKNLLINIFLAFVVKGLSLIIAVFSTPLYIGYFDNNAVLGVWYTILSILTWISVCDLGLGNGLRNTLTEDLAQKNYKKAKKTIASTYAALAVIMLPVAILGIIGISFVNLNDFFNISIEALDENSLRIATSILLFGIATSFIIKPINNIIYALQKSSINNIIALVTSIIPLVFILCSKFLPIRNKIVTLAIVHISAIFIPLIIATVLVFSRGVMKKIKPRICDIQKDTAKNMFGFGMKFFVAQIFFLLLMSTNELMISKMFSSEDVVQYSIYYKLFTLFGSLSMLALTPLWSKITRDLALNRIGKIKSTIKILYGLSFIAIIIEFLLVPFLQIILDIWLGENSFSVNYITAFSFAYFGGMYVLNTALTTLANGIGEMKTQIIVYGIGALLKVPVTITLKSMVSNWCVVTLYNAIILFAFCLIQTIWLKKWILRKEKSMVTTNA